MLINDLQQIGANLYRIRKNMGLTQAEVAERAELSDRTYADIERGSANMRMETLLKICLALNITPNDILVLESPITVSEEELLQMLNCCAKKERETALKILGIYVESINKK